MLEQEQEHLAFFEEQIRTRCIRPTAASFYAAGWVLGAASACIGAEAAMAVTVAVEETIDAHYQQQSTALEYNPQDNHYATKSKNSVKTNCNIVTPPLNRTQNKHQPICFSVR